MATLAASFVSVSSYEAASQGNRDAIEALLVDYQTRIARDCSRLKGSIAARQGAEDAAQMVLLSVFRSLAAGDWAGLPEADFALWVRKQARNRCRKFVLLAQAKMRDVRREKCLDGAETRIDLPGREKDPAEQVADAEAPSGIVAALLASVTCPVNQAILRGVSEGKSLAEIAAEIGIEVAIVYGRIKRLRQKAAKLAA